MDAAVSPVMVAFAAGKHAPLDHVQDVTALEMPRLFVAIASSRYITPGVSEVSSTSPGETGTHDGVIACHAPELFWPYHRYSSVVTLGESTTMTNCADSAGMAEFTGGAYENETTGAEVSTYHCTVHGV